MNTTPNKFESKNTVTRFLFNMVANMLLRGRDRMAGLETAAALNHAHPGRARTDVILSYSYPPASTAGGPAAQASMEASGTVPARSR